MDSRKIVLQETSVIAIGEAICVPLMTLAFFLCGHFDRTVVFGGIAGALIATANFFFMALSTSLAADKAQQQDVKGGQATMRFSYIFRLIFMFVSLVICAKSGMMDLLALVIPLALIRPIIMIAEFFRGKGGTTV